MKLLSDANIKDGKIFLQVQAANLKAVIAFEAAHNRLATKEIADLRKVEAELKKFGNTSTATLKESAKAWIEQGLAAAIGADSASEAAARMAGAILQSLA